MTKKIAWDISHQEFTIEDHYFFSTLKLLLKNAGAEVNETASLSEIENYDVVVFNYPEKAFTDSEGKLVREIVSRGGKAIACGYYKNEDNVASCINSLSLHFGLFLNSDEVRDEVSNDGKDPLFVVTTRVLSYSTTVKRVVLPCTGSISIKIEKEKGLGKPIILGEPTAYSSSDSDREVILGAETTVGEGKGKGKGKFILIGTCVFWDNFSIKKYNNLDFSLNLLLNSTLSTLIAEDGIKSR